MLNGFLLAFFAGISTAVGGLLIFLIRDFKKYYLGFSLAFATGVMLMVSFVEILPAGIEVLGYGTALTLFFVGSCIAFFTDFFVPHSYLLEDENKGKVSEKRLFRIGVLVALGVSIHNLPEGFAIFAASLSSIKLGIVIALAIAIHNIAEGFAVSMPVYYATKSRKKAFLASFLSGIAEPLGAVIAAVFLVPLLSAQLIGASLAIVAGIMVYICIDELLPVAYDCVSEKQHIMTFGFFVGCAVMGITLVMLV
ncbi:MAG: zinc transporter ZupT [Candidatus Diapherotrites archaeon]|nr:zinc transporter ZupT [Candidatus Diapherotrites archaeon]